jgi:hypothetical protein
VFNHLGEKSLKIVLNAPKAYQNTVTIASIVIALGKDPKPSISSSSLKSKLEFSRKFLAKLLKDFSD